MLRSVSPTDERRGWPVCENLNRSMHADNRHATDEEVVNLLLGSKQIRVKESCVRKARHVKFRGYVNKRLVTEPVTSPEGQGKRLLTRSQPSKVKLLLKMFLLL